MKQVTNDMILACNERGQSRSGHIRRGEHAYVYITILILCFEIKKSLGSVW
jgi:hypothetical protein